MKVAHTVFLVRIGLVLLLAGAQHVQGQWTKQTILLSPGWNAVHVDVRPEPDDCDSIFSGLPIESVWAWNRRSGEVQFIQDPSTLIPAQADWLTWLPSNHPLASRANLFTIEGGKSYLIQVAQTSAAVTLTLRGRPSLRPVEWIPNSLNCVGFPVGNAPSSFGEFFAGSAAHANGPVYRLNSAGNWEAAAMDRAMEPGEAFWIRCNGSSTFQGPMRLVLAQGTGLNYGRTLVEQTVMIQNASDSPRTLAIRSLPSADPPSGTSPVKAGEVPMHYWKFDRANNQAGWTPFPDSLSRIGVPAGETWTIRIEVRRSEMAAFTPPQGVSGVLYQSLLEVTDGGGTTRILIPVTAEGLQDFAQATRSIKLRSSASASVHPRAGLWVGAAEINKVNQPAGRNPEEALPVAVPFQFRILVHVDGDGRAHLLQKVLQVWRDGIYRPDPDDNSKLIVDQPGHEVLITDERLLPNFTGTVLRDGEPVARRFSSAAFGFRDPILLNDMSGFGENGAILSGKIVCAYNDPLNPFVHRYHPDHDNLNEENPPAPLPIRDDGQGPYTTESFTISRNVELEFTENDPFNLSASLAGWGDNRIGGLYRETILGLHKRPLIVSGYFVLQAASRVAELNDQPLSGAPSNVLPRN